MKTIISIPVHEKPEVIHDQINNINKYFPEAEVVLHVSKSYFEQWRIEEIEDIKGVYINPTHLETTWGDIVLPHVSNFEYIEKLGVDYDYFMMHSSNDMYVCYGVAEYIAKYEAGFNMRYMRKKNTYWWPCAMAWDDPWLNSLMGEVTQTKIVASQVEGSFYSRELICKIMNAIKNTIEKNVEKKGVYTREEFSFSTVAEKLVNHDHVGYPIVFSEVHRFDRELWRDFELYDRLYQNLLMFFMPRSFFDRLKGRHNRKKFEKRKFKTTPEIVDKIRKRNEEYISKNRYLNDGSGTCQLYGEADSLFAVKRVAREINDTLREYIRNVKD